LYCHVKPYTITRGWADSATPTLEHEAANLISVNDKPILREIPLSDRFGINVKLIGKERTDPFGQMVLVAMVPQMGPQKRQPRPPCTALPAKNV
jgi:hypothetical protein